MATVAERRRQTRDKLAQIEKALSQLRRKRGRLAVQVITQRADGPRGDTGSYFDPSHSG